MISWSKQKTELASGDVSEADLFEATLKRIHVDTQYKAWNWTYDSYDAAMAQRPRATVPGFDDLTGLHLAVKDIYNSITGTTEMGSASWAGHTAGNDARVLAEFIYNGATMVGKTKTAEFAVHALPDTLNPWNVDVTPGTSSTGSAVAVALGHVPVALGTQTAGSITRPASFCSVIGYKPTQGIHPRTAVLKTCDPFDTVGCFASSLDDLPVLFEATRVRGDNYPIVERRLLPAYDKARDGSKLRIGVVQSPCSNQEETSITQAVQGFVDGLPKDRFHVQPVDLIQVLAGVGQMHDNIYNKSLSYYFQPERAKGETFSKVLEEIFVLGDGVSTEEYRSNLVALPDIRNRVAEQIADFDLLIAPSTATVAPKRGEMEREDTSRFWTLLHFPTVSLPLFQDSASGLPFGVQIIGARKFSDPLVFEFLKAAQLDDSALVKYR